MSICRIHSLLNPSRKDHLKDIKNFEDTLGNFVLYLALSDLLQHIGIKATYRINICGRNLLYAYLNKSLTLEEVVTQVLHHGIECNTMKEFKKPREIKEKLSQWVGVNDDVKLNGSIKIPAEHFGNYTLIQNIGI